MLRGIGNISGTEVRIINKASRLVVSGKVIRRGEDRAGAITPRRLNIIIGSGFNFKAGPGVLSAKNIQ